MDGASWRAEDVPGRAATVAASRGEDLVAIGLGAVVTGAVGVARMFFAWWPFHPLGLAFAIGYGAQAGWFSFFVAWLAKFLTLRYGGVHLYRRLVPAAIGLAMGEAMALCVYSLVKAIVFETTGAAMPAYHYALPP
ncbi:MAG: hypothetical protein H0X45_07105 [Planctomycetes bacterium]|nr:hypothetical protein [Planctomycetota bacterium]